MKGKTVYRCRVVFPCLEVSTRQFARASQPSRHGGSADTEAVLTRSLHNDAGVGLPAQPGARKSSKLWADGPIRALVGGKVMRRFPAQVAFFLGVYRRLFFVSLFLSFARGSIGNRR